MTTAEAGRQVTDDIRDRVSTLGEGDTQVLSASVRVAEDSTGQMGLKVTLTLPVPRGASWDPEKLLYLRRAAREVAYETMRERGAALDGATTVDVTTADAEGDDIALEEDPEPGEATGREE